MTHPATSLTKLLSIGAFALLAGCTQQNAAPVAEATPYNPPGTALAARKTPVAAWPATQCHLRSLWRSDE